MSSVSSDATSVSDGILHQLSYDNVFILYIIIALLHRAKNFLGKMDKSIHLRAPQGQYGQDQENQGSFDTAHAFENSYRRQKN